MSNIIVGNDSTDLLQGAAVADVIYGYDPNWPQSQASAIAATRVGLPAGFAGASRRRGRRHHVKEVSLAQLHADDFLIV